MVLVRHGESDWNKQNRFHGVDRRRSVGKGPREPRKAARFSSPGLHLRHRLHFRSEAGHPNSLDRPGRDGPDVGSGAQFLAAQRAPLRRPAKALTSPKPPPSSARTRSRSGRPQLRRPASAAREGRSPLPGHEARYKQLTQSELPLTECLKDTVARFLLIGTRRSRPPFSRERSDRSCPRQQSARAGEVSRQDLRRADREPYTFRPACARLRARRDLQPLKSYYLATRKGKGGHGSRRRAGKKK